MLLAAALCASDAEPPVAETSDVPLPALEREPAEEYPPPADARELMRATLARLPVEPLTLKGLLTVRRQRGVVLREVPFAIQLNWGAPQPSAEYELQDNFGRVVERLAVRQLADGTMETRWRGADGQVVTNPPSLADAIQGTDLTWLDLTLSFLWWDDARLDGDEDFRGSRCDKVIVAPPRPIPGCAAMRLWIDRRLRFIRQVEQLDAAGRRVRRMWVSSVARSGDRWMIRNMEVERPGSGQRTKLHVEDLGGA